VAVKTLRVGAVAGVLAVVHSVVALPLAPANTASALHAVSVATASGEDALAERQAPGDPGRVDAAFLDPYDVYDASSLRLETMFAAQKSAGIGTVIYQWSGWMYDDRTVATTYPAGVGTGYGHFDNSLPKVLAAAEKQDIEVWVGLLLRNEVFDSPATRSNAPFLRQFQSESIRLAADLFAKYGDRIAGWYIPAEPGDYSISSPAVTQLHTRVLATISDGLHRISPHLPVMVSPAVPRAIFVGLSGVDFVSLLEPLIRGAGIDVWNLQVGFKMTAWSPADDVALIRRGQQIAVRHGATVWADIYVPGPGRHAGDPPEPNFPTDPHAFLAEIRALASTSAPIAIWTFDDAMNPDPSRANATDRDALFSVYQSR